MVANVKYYVVTIVSIFLAIGIGIFIGFMLDAQDILTSQKDDIVSQLESRFDYLKEENQKIKKESENTNKENKRLEEFNRIVYPEMVKDRLSGIKVAVIETNDDYVYSGINQTLELAGADIKSNTTINDLMMTDVEKLKEIYKNVTGKEEENIQKTVIREVTSSLIKGETTPLVQALKEQGIINISGIYNEPLQYIIIAGGSNDKGDERYKIIDENIIDVAKKSNIPVIGIEKENVKYSYIDKYKNSRISSVDNVNSIIGKITLVLAMDGHPGNYGVKPSAESLAPAITPLPSEQ
ncbi:hypothetical protein DUF3186 [Gottschalkia acidurici 9a]|uniref:Copper transporter n=1 Tax=Gottschalkia acidurici (strain ATCC 7906 / DSM 604 / BCRC 14475 / CIP 104303 / KCTC 5404 / NCIMB 10678 / 9a) TaxID=1128398 RepID=K0AX97_GOTA9|nr:copper transporter [Gottschalkia acidurici]AFS78408.1 hypothetical protein DUF3186 [Gottschalkia acidurici 9a]